MRKEENGGENEEVAKSSINTESWVEQGWKRRNEGLQGGNVTTGIEHLWSHEDTVWTRISETRKETYLSLQAGFYQWQYTHTKCTLVSSFTVASQDNNTLHQAGVTASHRVLAMTLFFLGCWLTGLPTVLPFFNEPFLASSRCFSAQETTFSLSLTHFIAPGWIDTWKDAAPSQLRDHSNLKSHSLGSEVISGGRWVWPHFETIFSLSGAWNCLCDHSITVY